MPTRAGSAYLDVEADFDAIVAEFRAKGAAAGAAFEAAFDPELDIDAAGAEATLTRLQARLTALSTESPSIKIDVDSAGAMAQIASVQGALDGIGGGGLPGVGGGGGAAGGFRLLGSGLGGIAAMAGAVVLALSLIGPVLALITGLAIGLTGVLAGLALGIGVVVAAISPVIAAYAALGQQEQQAAQDAESRKRQEQAKAKAIVAAREQERAAEQRLADAKADAARQEEDAARRVTDAQRGLADARRNAEQGREQALRSIADAERSLAAAQEQSRRAQESVNEARAAAREDLEALQRTVAGQGLREEQAAVDVEKARERLNRAASGQQPFSNFSDQLQAQLDLKQAVARQQEVKRQGAQQRRELAEATRLGVEGSKRVTEAKEQERAAAQRVRDQERAVTDARRAAVEQARSGAAQIADAERSVSDARRAAADAQVAGQRKIADAVRAQARAQDATREAQNRQIETTRRQASAFDQLPPAGQRFVRYLQSTFVPGVRGLLGQAMTGFLPGLQQAMRNLQPVVAPLGAFLRQTGRLLGDLLVQASEALNQPFWRKWFSDVGEFAQGALARFLPSLGRLVTGFAVFVGTLISSGAADRLVDFFLSMIDSTGKFFENFSKSKGFDKFVDYLINDGPVVAQQLGDLAKGLLDLLEGLGAGTGMDLIALLGAFGRVLQAIPPQVWQYMSQGAMSLGNALRILAWILDRVADGLRALKPLLNTPLGKAAMNAIFGPLASTITTGGGGGGWRSGGYTGDGDPAEVADVVHRREVVFEAPVVDRLGLGFLMALRAGAQRGHAPALGRHAGFAGGGSTGGRRMAGGTGAAVVRLSDEDRDLLSKVAVKIDGRTFATIVRGVKDKESKR